MKKIIIALLIFEYSLSSSYSFNRLSPDSVVMKNGTCYHGLIIKRSAKEILLQQSLGEKTIQRSEIERIDDSGKSMIYFDDLVDPNKAPPWRMMVQDLRCNDAIKSFVQIPATRIEEGYLRNVPYLSFHINKHAEMNVYGDPKDPACVELGIYARGEKLQAFQEIARDFFAGYISSRSALATFYSLNLKGDEKRSGKFIFKIMPPQDPQSLGAWWISIYDPKRLEKARLSNAAYQKVTLPATKVRTKNGTLQKNLQKKYQAFLAASMLHLFGKVPGFLGFYRDENNQLKILPFHAPAINGEKLPSRPSP